MHRIAVALAVSLPLVAGLPLPKAEAVQTERVDFAPGGTIRIEGSTGELNVEGWDEPAVEVTVTRYSWGGHADLDRIQVAKPALTGAHELTIDTSHKRFARARVDYRIRVPRDSSLVIHHDRGDVVVYDVRGDIDATARLGGIMLQLPAAAEYAIDAKNKTGGEIQSDFPGKTHFNRLLLGDSLKSDAPAAAHRLHLRVRTGGITIQKMAA